MRRTLALGAACLSMLLIGATGAQAADDPVPPAFSPPAPAPVTDVASAESFLEGYASDNARRFLRVNRSRVRVLDVEARCLQHPVTLTRYGCAFTLRALVIQRRHNWRNWEHGHSARKSGHGQPQPRHRVRIRTFGCLGIARIDAPPAATPTVRIPLVDCQRVPRRDLVAPEPV